MRKNLQSKVLLSILAASVFYLPACANAAELTITDTTQETDSTISDCWKGEIIDLGISHNAIYHAPETEGNKLIITGEPEFLKNYPYLAAAHIKMKVGDSDNFTEAKLEKNEVTITSSNFAARYYVYGAYADLTDVTDGSKASLISNTIKVENGTFNVARFSGAYAVFNNNVNSHKQFDATAALQNNSVTVSDISFTSTDTTIEGAYASIREIQTMHPSQADAPAVTLTGNTVTVNDGTKFNGQTSIYGARTEMRQNRMFDPFGITLSADLTGNTVTINDGTKFNGQTSIYGACADLNRSRYISTNNESSLTNNSVNINGGSFSSSSNSNIYGAYINLDSVQKADRGNSESTVSGNNVTIRGGTFNAATNVYGVYANLTKYIKPNEANHPGTVAISDNTVTLTGSAGAYDEATQARDLKNVNLYGYAYDNGDLEAGKDQITDVNGKKLSELVKDSELGNLNNNLIVDGWSGTVGSVNNFANINFENIKVAVIDDENKTPAASVFYIEDTNEGANKGLPDTKVNINSVAVGDYEAGTELSVTLTLDDAITANNIEISENLKNKENAYFASDNDDNGVIANKFETLNAAFAKGESDTENKHVIEINAKVSDTILAGKFIDAKGKEHINSNGEASLTVNEDLSNTNASVIAGAYAAGDNAATGGELIVNGGTITKDLYAGYAENGDVKNNTLTLTGSADVSSVNLFGANTNTSGATEGNKLTIDDWKGTVKSLNNFAAIDFNNIAWENGSTVLTIADTDADLSSTQINLNSLKGGSTIKAGDTMTFVASADGHDLKITDVTVDKDKFLAGVALEGEGTATVGADGTVTYTITSVELTPQTDIVAETRAASAAFVNQGTDLINDSLDVLGRDGTYGVKTFAAVQGNRSSYDVADDLKINGWSVIAGFGAENEHKGGDFAWGVFYENGSGNYRTYNTFNNEFFRGDGSMVYNGGGIAARYENAKGVYTEGSLRAGMLKTEMDNALRDSSGASYGYDSESTYYGAHIGVGKIISLSDSSDLDVYGKFFHTYTEGDSFTVDKDKFEFDSITSDRLRIGARVTTNKANAFSTYYGLAYEYEFNGDADMRAQNLKAPTQSLQGSSYMAEVGFNYQPTPDSPWSFDLNMRGYAGEREGASFNVQATYTF